MPVPLRASPVAPSHSLAPAVVTVGELSYTQQRALLAFRAHPSNSVISHRLMDGEGYSYHTMVALLDRHLVELWEIDGLGWIARLTMPGVLAAKVLRGER